MICYEYEQLTPLERRDFIGALVHVVMSNSDLFKEGQKLIKKGEKAGLFIGVQINPSPPIPETNKNQ